MHITYDPKADVLAITWSEKASGGGKEVAPDLFVDCDAAGQPISVELLNARKHTKGDPLSVNLELLAPEMAPASGR